VKDTWNISKVMKIDQVKEFYIVDKTLKRHIGNDIWITGNGERRNFLLNFILNPTINNTRLNPKVLFYHEIPPTIAERAEAEVRAGIKSRQEAYYYLLNSAMKRQYVGYMEGSKYKVGGLQCVDTKHELPFFEEVLIVEGDAKHKLFKYRIKNIPDNNYIKTLI